MRAPLVIAAGAAAGYALPLPAAHVPRLAHALGIDTTLMLPGPHLTFDDGPHPEATPKVLELLRDHDLRATFFLVGEQVRRTGALRDEIEAAGHAIALHGDTHRPMWRLTPRALKADLDRGEDTVRPTVDFHRAPYGAYSLPALYEVVGRGFNPLLWSRWGRDWRAKATREQITRDVTRDLSAHDVLLLHDADDYADPGSWRTMLAALPAVIEAVIAAQPTG
ncbi:MAG: polysaccharide deacetylase family protein [Actinobacteria bacterium]|nr:MAG: polysaccharide deacetylase family protein [Actinomycetota bacterium]